MHSIGAREYPRVGLELPIGRERHPKRVQIGLRQSGGGWAFMRRDPCRCESPGEAGRAGVGHNGRMIRKFDTKLNFRCSGAISAGWLPMLFNIMHTMSMDVGAHLKSVRQMYGLSQRELAKRAGVTNGLISLIEQNRVSLRSAP